MSVQYYTVSVPALSMNPWEHNALDYNYPESSAAAVPLVDDDTVHDSIIYPGIYAPSGFDILNLLFRVAMRPAPVVDIGPVDASCAIVVCSIEQHDCPIVYANEPCLQLTGYSLGEMVGRNCRFMQAPGGQVSPSSKRPHIDKSVMKKMRKAVESNSEIAVEVINFKKNGDKFTNLLTMIPVCWDTSTPKYFVGFMAEVET
ncbi:vivid PAS protein VVD [Astrocystis sublimbata]|nr:vivid PAS protein VVD [Astrocystis sublimbata]